MDIRANRPKAPGQGVVEYVIIVVLVAIIILVGIRLYGRSVECQFTNAASEVEATLGTGGLDSNGCPVPKFNGRDDSVLPPKPRPPRRRPQSRPPGAQPVNPPPTATSAAPATSVPATTTAPATSIPPTTTAQTTSTTTVESVSTSQTTSIPPNTTTAASTTVEAPPPTSVPAPTSAPAPYPSPAPSATPPDLCYSNIFPKGNCVWDNTRLGDKCIPPGSTDSVTCQPECMTKGAAYFDTYNSYCSQFTTQSACTAAKQSCFSGLTYGKYCSALTSCP